MLLDATAPMLACAQASIGASQSNPLQNKQVTAEKPPWTSRHRIAALLNDRSQLVTGASSGMGKEFAARLIAEGYIVYGAARRIGRMEDLAKLGVPTIEMDLTVDDSIVSAIERVVEEGRLDVRVNNAGYG